MDSEGAWYQTGVVYQLHVRAFFDSNGDGIGDFNGLTQKLDHLEDLGVSAIWLLPFYPSPLRDDGYDISDYFGIHPSYGTLRNFRGFLRAAHRRNLRVITELVLNHTSDQHPWFQRARRAVPGSAERDFYVWSQTAEKYLEARIIFQDFETSNWTWDPVAGAYYWHRFFHHQPDLNYDNPKVRQAILAVVDHWLGMGVDGLRLDGVPYLFEREGTPCENLPETHRFLARLRAHVDGKYRGRMLLAEANQWPEDAAAYFGTGDECHTAFHFPLMPRMYMAVQMEDRFPIVDILEQTPAIPPACQWMLFLRNHDELTLEMVTEQERDSMYRFYAREQRARLNLGIRRRLAPLMDNDRRKVELLNGLLLSLPGTPVLYYGDEIGMGDNIYLGDRNGVRTPMQWSADRNAGFSQANPQQLYLPPIIDYEYHYEAINVETQGRNPHSLLSWMRQVLRLRQRVRPLTQGMLRFLHPENPRVLAFVRSSGPEHVLVAANLSHSAQFVALDLSEFRGRAPVEAFGQTRFPPIGDSEYVLTLAPYAFLWFSLMPAEAETPLGVGERAVPELAVAERWENVLAEDAEPRWLPALGEFLASRPWHRRSGIPRTVSVLDVVSIPGRATAHAATVKRPSADRAGVELAIVRADYGAGRQDVYAIPLAFAPEGLAPPADLDRKNVALARVQVAHDHLHEFGYVYDASGDGSFAESLFDLIAGGRAVKSPHGRLLAKATRAFPRIQGETPAPVAATAKEDAHTNTIVLCGDRFLLKVYRRLEEGAHPEVEMISRLVETAGFGHVAPIAGTVEYRPTGRGPITLAVLEEFVPHEQTAWQFTLDALDAFFETVTVMGPSPVPLPDVEFLPHRPVVELAERPAPPLAGQLFGAYLRAMERLGRRVAELHGALAGKTDDPAFGPERLLPFHQQALFQSVRGHVRRAAWKLQQTLPRLPASLQELGRVVLERKDAHLESLRGGSQRPLAATRIRCHGSLDLTEILCSGDDFVVVDFEGDREDAFSQRRTKSSPVRDLAGLIWSLQRAGRWALEEYRAATAVDAVADRLDQWIGFWTGWAAAELIRSYLAVAGSQGFVPRPAAGMQWLLDLYLTDKCVRQLLAELEPDPARTQLSLEHVLLCWDAHGRR